MENKMRNDRQKEHCQFLKALQSSMAINFNKSFFFKFLKAIILQLSKEGL